MYAHAEAQVDRIQIAFIRALAGQHRLRIIHLLGAGSMGVGELMTALGLPQAAVSQNLAAMRSAGLVEATRDGRSMRYRLADPEILAACLLMREVIVRRLSALGNLAAALGDQADRPLLPIPASDPALHPAQVTPR